MSAELSGFSPARYENVLVRAGQTATLQISLKVGGLTEQVQVTAESPTVDVTTAQTGQDITLQLTEALPPAAPIRATCSWSPACCRTIPRRPGIPRPSRA